MTGVCVQHMWRTHFKVIWKKMLMQGFEQLRCLCPQRHLLQLLAEARRAPADASPHPALCQDGLHRDGSRAFAWLAAGSWAPCKWAPSKVGASTATFPMGKPRQERVHRGREQGSFLYNLIPGGSRQTQALDPGRHSLRFPDDSFIYHFS